MKKALGFGMVLLVFAGCATWDYKKLNATPALGNSPAAKSCAECHDDRFASWKHTPHADSSAMAKITVPQFRECGACHDSLAAHQADPGNANPPKISTLSKAEQNAICGKCHFDKDLLGSGAINPYGRHGLLMSAGFQGYDDTLSCLECHGGHSPKTDMLLSIRAHTCFKCHKEAIVTMGVFQPLNYLAAGKICVSCHPAHGASAPHQAVRLAGGLVLTCLICHPNGNPSQLWLQKNSGDRNGGGNGDD